MTNISKVLDALQGDIQDEVLKWHRELYLNGKVDAADAVAFALQLVNEQFAGIKKAEGSDADCYPSQKLGGNFITSGCYFDGMNTCYAGIQKDETMSTTESEVEE